MHEATEVRVGQGWWTSQATVWLVDALEGDTAVLARWCRRAPGAPLEREELRVPAGTLLAGAGGWRPVPDGVVEQTMRDVSSLDGATAGR